MAESPESQPPYRVDLSQAVSARVWKLQNEAAHSGRGDQFLSAFKRIINRLERDPWEAGEPMYRLPALRMLVRCVSIRPLVVDYAVCEDHPLVIIKGVKLLSGR